MKLKIKTIKNVVCHELKRKKKKKKKKKLDLYFIELKVKTNFKISTT
jgi:hypothetical protein